MVVCVEGERERATVIYMYYSVFIVDELMYCHDFVLSSTNLKIFFFEPTFLLHFVTNLVFNMRNKATNLCESTDMTLFTSQTNTLNERYTQGRISSQLLGGDLLGRQLDRAATMQHVVLRLLASLVVLQMLERTTTHNDCYYQQQIQQQQQSQQQQQRLQVTIDRLECGANAAHRAPKTAETVPTGGRASRARAARRR
jgi:hypothetical protein